MEEIQKEWTIEQLAPYLKNYRQFYIVRDDTQTNHPDPKIQETDWMKDSTPQAHYSAY